MKKNGKRLVLSVGAVLTALAVVAGATMAWFSDTEPLAADFSSGKLDITVTPDQAEPNENKIDFENLRPMTETAFESELTVSNGKIVNADTNGYDPTPVYFHPVTISNEGTLPAQVLFTMVDGGADGVKDVDEITVENVEVNGKVYGEKVTQTGEKVACDESNYILKDKLKIFVYEKNASNKWEKVPGVNLNKASLETGETAEFQPFTSTDSLKPGADNKEQFLIAGYLPKDAGNAYQAKHYHGVLMVYAGQTDEDAEWGPIEEKLAAPTMSGEPVKAMLANYYNIQLNEDYNMTDAWIDAVQEVTVNGEKFAYTDAISFNETKTYALSKPDRAVRIGGGSFEEGETYHVVFKAKGYEDFTFDIVTGAPKLAAPTMSGKPEKAMFSNYYDIQLKEDYAMTDAWIDAVQGVTVNGETFTKTDTISFNETKTYALLKSDRKVQIGGGSFEEGETYHVVFKADGYEDFTFDITTEGVAKPAAPKVVGKVKKDLYASYYALYIDEDRDATKAWMDKVTSVTVDGEEFTATGSIGSNYNKTYRLHSDARIVYIGGKSFQDGETYQVVIKANGYKDLKCEIVVNPAILPAPAINGSEIITYTDGTAATYFRDDYMWLKAWQKKITSVTVDGRAFTKVDDVTVNDTNTYQIPTSNVDGSIKFGGKSFKSGQTYHVVIEATGYETYEANLKVV